MLDHDGETAEVQGSGSKPYQLKNSGGVLSCNCPAWRNQSVPIDKRTCKHLRKLRGSAVEDARIGTVTTGRLQAELQSIARHMPEKAETANFLAGELSPEAERIHARAAAQGRKLRPDEKTKLNGPPVLLAHAFEDSDVSPEGWWMSEKLDGVRAYWDGQNFISRQGNIFHAPVWFKDGLPDHKLDGELWIDRRSFQNTISIVKSIDAGERWKAVKYLCFDLPDSKLPFEERQEALVEAAMASSSKIFKLVDQSICKSLEHLKQELDRLVKLGAEGLMIRKPGSLYVAGRSDTILKVKPWREAEAQVIGYEAGKGRHKGRTGGLVMKIGHFNQDVRLKHDGEFHIGTGLSDENRRNPPKIGAQVTFRYMDTTNDGLPKGASFVAVRDYE